MGLGKKPAEWPGQVLAGRQRDPAVLVVPAHGLTLEQVAYPPASELATQAAAAKTLRSL